MSYLSMTTSKVLVITSNVTWDVLYACKKSRFLNVFQSQPCTWLQMLFSHKTCCLLVTWSPKSSCQGHTSKSHTYHISYCDGPPHDSRFAARPLHDSMYTFPIHFLVTPDVNCLIPRAYKVEWAGWLGDQLAGMPCAVHKQGLPMWLEGRLTRWCKCLHWRFGAH